MVCGRPTTQGSGILEVGCDQIAASIAINVMIGITHLVLWIQYQGGEALQHFWVNTLEKLNTVYVTSCQAKINMEYNKRMPQLTSDMD